MLVQFTVQNFLSFKDETVFKLLPTSDSRHSEHIQEIPGQKVKVLKTAAIYGANGSGKTNLVKAIEFLKELIIDGTKVKQGIPVRRFKLSDKSQSLPAHFELEFICKNILYSYGIIVDDVCVREEWLFATNPNGREVKFFERITTENNEVQVQIGPQMSDEDQGKDFLMYVAQGTRPEQPFLTEAESRNVKSIHDLMEWFRDRLTIVQTSTIYNSLPLRIHKDKTFTKALGFFLKAAGTGIERIETDESDLDFDKHFPDIPHEAKQDILSGLNGKSHLVIGLGKSNDDLILINGTKERPKIVRLFTIHKAADGTETQFSFSEESSGTRRAVHLFPALFKLIYSKSGGVFIIDEIDRSLHPLLSRLFLETFIRYSGKNTQLIFTTHEACLLDLELLRRDEIWFIEKDKDEASHCYPLTDFKIRPDLEIKRGYLNGRFGAIPFFNDTSALRLMAEQ